MCLGGLVKKRVFVLSAIILGLSCPEDLPASNAPANAPANPFGSSLASCEALFEAVPGAVAGSPIVRRALNDLVLQRTVYARKQRAARARTTSGSYAQGRFGSAGPSTSSAQPAFKRAPPRLAIQISPRFAIERLVWMGPDLLRLDDGAQVTVATGTSKNASTKHQNVLLIDAATGDVEAKNIYVSSEQSTENPADDRALVLAIARPSTGRFDYHFVSPKTMQATRAPISDVTHFNVVGDYFSYVEYSTPAGTNRIGSLRGTPATDGRVFERFDDLLDIADDGSVIVTTHGYYAFNSVLNTYTRDSYAHPAKTITDDRAGFYRVQQSRFTSWQIDHHDGTGRVHRTLLEPALGGLAFPGSVDGLLLESIVGEGPHRTAFITHYDVRFGFDSKKRQRVYAVVLGDAPVVKYSRLQAYGEVKKLNRRFVLLFEEHRARTGDDYEVWALDVETGTSHALKPPASPGFKAHKTALVSDSQYITVSEDAVTGLQTVSLRDLGTRAELRSMVVTGDAEVINGTYVLRIQSELTTTFYDARTGFILWSGDRTKQAEVSPDGRLVAYRIQDQIFIESLGSASHQTRRAL